MKTTKKSGGLWQLALTDLNHNIVNNAPLKDDVRVTSAPISSSSKEIASSNVFGDTLSPKLDQSINTIANWYRKHKEGSYTFEKTFKRDKNRQFVDIKNIDRLFNISELLKSEGLVDMDIYMDCEIEFRQLFIKKNKSTLTNICISFYITAPSKRVVLAPLKTYSHKLNNNNVKIDTKLIDKGTYRIILDLFKKIHNVLVSKTFEKKAYYKFVAPRHLRFNDLRISIEDFTDYLKISSLLEIISIWKIKNNEIFSISFQNEPSIQIYRRSLYIDLKLTEMVRPINK